MLPSIILKYGHPFNYENIVHTNINVVRTTLGSIQHLVNRMMLGFTQLQFPIMKFSPGSFGGHRRYMMFNLSEP